MKTIDYETSAAVTAGLGELQEIVSERLRRLPIAFADLDTDAQAEFCIRSEQHVNFELKHNDAAFVGMPLIAEGNGVFLVETNDDERTMLVQCIAEGDTLRGIIEPAKVRPVPPLSVVLEQSAASMREVEVAVLLRLGAAVFESEGREYELDQQYTTYLSLTYPGLRYDRPNLTLL